MNFKYFKRLISQKSTKTLIEKEKNRFREMKIIFLFQS